MFEELHRPLGRAGFQGAIRFLIVSTGVVFLLQQFAGPSWVSAFGLVPRSVLQGGALWQLFTYQFLHGGMFHWLFNMFVLWMFGRELEVRWGTRYFLFYYFLCGIGAGLFTLLFMPNSGVPTIGASGAGKSFFTNFSTRNH